MNPLYHDLHHTKNSSQAHCVSATLVQAQDCDYESPDHAHEQGQLVLALAGGVRCVINGQVWMVPPQAAVWIPPHHVHTNYVTHNAQVCMVFVAAQTSLPNIPAGVLSVSVLLRELLLRLVDLQAAAEMDTTYQHHLVALLLLELQAATTQAFAIPVLQHERLQVLYQALVREPNHVGGSGYWANKLAMSERNLSRLVKQDTGLSFARWRQQVQLLHALLQLAAGKSVQQVSMDLGYESVSAFITGFKKRLGVTPKRYVLSQQL